jgi:hypothetical protein
MTSARTLVDTLRRQYDEDGWDLAETSLASSENTLRRIEDALPHSPMLQHHSMPVPASQADHMETEYLNGYPSNGNGMHSDGFAGYQAHGSIEELFPEIFSDFQDTALFTSPGLVN